MNLIDESSKGPNGLALECEARIAVLLLQRDATDRTYAGRCRGRARALINYLT